MLNYENSVNFSKGEQPPVLMRNFCEAEDGFIWSMSKWCDVNFDFNSGGAKPRGSADLLLDLSVFKAPPILPGQNVFIYLNGLRIGSYHITSHINCIASFDPAILRSTDNVLTFDTPDAARPEDFGIPDGRILGIQLFSIQIRPAR
jgi:hypothetical protein